MIPLKTYDSFERITSYPIKTYLFDYLRFIDNDYDNIIAYFKGDDSEIEPSSLFNLNYLLGESDRIQSLFELNNNNFKGSDYWELLIEIEDIRVNLKTILKSAKFLRSSKTDFNFSNLYQYDYIKKYLETLESISRRRNKSSDFDNEWIDIALRNNLSELDYDESSGVKMKLSTPLNKSPFVQSVVDVITGETIKGLDIQAVFDFQDDDLVVLTYDETIKQALSILSNLIKGSVPEFPNFGLDLSLMVGTNVNTLSFPPIIRQLKELFDTDDTFSDFKITRVGYNKQLGENGQAAEIAFEVSSRSGEIYNDILLIE